MEKVVHLFEIFKTIFLFKIFELGKAIFEAVENSNDFNQFEFEFKLNLTRRHYNRGPLVSAQPPLLSVVPRTRCPPAPIDHGPVPAADRRASPPPLSTRLSLPRGLRPGPPPSHSSTARRTDQRHHRHRPPLSFPPSLPPSLNNALYKIIITQILKILFTNIYT
jgi:hypothetical protein